MLLDGVGVVDGSDFFHGPGNCPLRWRSSRCCSANKPCRRWWYHLEHFIRGGNDPFSVVGETFISHNPLWLLFMGFVLQNKKEDLPWRSTLFKQSHWSSSAIDTASSTSRPAITGLDPGCSYTWWALYYNLLTSIPNRPHLFVPLLQPCPEAGQNCIMLVLKPS